MPYCSSFFLLLWEILSEKYGREMIASYKILQIAGLKGNINRPFRLLFPPKNNTQSYFVKYFSSEGGWTRNTTCKGTVR